MTCKILNGKEPAAKIKETVKYNLNNSTFNCNLAVIMVGNNPASQAYVRGKQRDCEECGIGFELLHFDENVEQDKLIESIELLNNRYDIQGILIQLPLPKHLDENELINSISPKKDVDCFCEVNLGKLFLNHPTFEPCTPKGIIELCNFYDIELEGKYCVIIGRSNIVGKPLSTMLTNRGATVTVCHSKTEKLKEHTTKADIVICAVGKRRFLTADMVKENAVIIDVGINGDDNGKLCGDADFDNLKLKVSAITPVPGGIGLMTRAVLMQNLEKAIGV